jgi:hypothetical protein
MAKRVFFSFHYQDVVDFRANVVRNHWLLKDDREAAGFFDASIWEETKKSGDAALKNLIHGGLKNTSNSCVLVGSETYKRPWVKYEIFKSIDVGNHLFAVHINSIKGKDQKTKPLGTNPFEWLGLRFNLGGTVATPIEYNGNGWDIYKKLDPIKLGTAMSQSFWNSGYKLSHWYKIYDWNSDDGYANFSNWVN